MGLRELAGDMARNTSGLWRGIADAVDPDGRRPSSRPSSAPPTSPSGVADSGPADAIGDHDGMMIVPLDTWTRILEQVGNVHEAGQQLADARERAARAETENRFLHEQLRELKAQRRTVRRSASSSDPATGPGRTTDPAAAGDDAPESRLVRVRRRASTWLDP